MPSRKFAVTIDYPDELSTDDVREWVTAALPLPTGWWWSRWAATATAMS